jgi:hypothetical protein
MPRYILDTDILLAELSKKELTQKQEHIMIGLRAAIKGKIVSPWLSEAECLIPVEKKGASIGGYSPAFLKFWEAYPPRNGTRAGKAQAMRAWKKVKGIKEPELLKICLSALEWQKQDESWVKDNGTFIPMATTYINQRRWEDEGNTPEDWEEYTDMNGALKKRRKH